MDQYNIGLVKYFTGINPNIFKLQTQVKVLISVPQTGVNTFNINVESKITEYMEASDLGSVSRP